MKNKLKARWGIFFGSIVFFIVVFAIYSATHYARENFSYGISHVNQNALDWLDPKTADQPFLTAKAQQELRAQYLEKYFSPWMSRNPIDFLWVKSNIHQIIRDYTRYPGYGINHLPNSSEWIESIARNIDLAHFPNAQMKVITIRNTNVRQLPTHQPSFGNFDEAGQGYPFDNLQVTSISPNTPAIILQKTRDGAWSYIVAHNDYGWVPTPALAIVNDQFIQRWETGHYMALIKNKTPIVDHHGLVRFTADIGKIMPRAPMDNDASVNTFPVLIAVPDSKQHAVIKVGALNQSSAVKWPMLPTPHHIAEIMNAMLGVKYGWGGLNDDSDCSLTTMNLFATFGIGLPRNSTLQADVGKVINLGHLSNREKEKMIASKGVPFFTLLHMPGHIVVYLGEKDGHIYIFQTVWGIHTRKLWGHKSRAVIGTTVISPANLGDTYINVTRTWLERMDKMVLFSI